MPRIQDEILESVIYIYGSKQAAKEGEQAGGSGFLVGVRLEVNKAWYEAYAVTNAHVINKARPRPTIRLNTTSGHIDVLETQESEWIKHPDLYDIAVLPIELSVEHRFWAIDEKWLISRRMAEILSLGPGDDVFMVGRFISHAGKQRNLPTVRFGNIATMPLEPIEDENGIKQESFLVECRSIGGYSGSPVFFIANPALPRPPYWATSHSPWRQSIHGPLLLGVNWCHIRDYDRVFADEGKTLIEPPEWVKANTGMAGVIPAWHLADLLNCEGLVKKRKEEDDRITEQKNASPVVLDSAEKPFTKQDFEQALRKVSRRTAKNPRAKT